MCNLYLDSWTLYPVFGDSFGKQTHMERLLTNLYLVMLFLWYLCGGILSNMEAKTPVFCGNVLGDGMGVPRLHT
jgi:hypothetical protein